VRAASWSAALSLVQLTRSPTKPNSTSLALAISPLSSSLSPLAASISWSRIRERKQRRLTSLLVGGCRWKRRERMSAERASEWANGARRPPLGPSAGYWRPCARCLLPALSCAAKLQTQRKPTPPQRQLRWRRRREGRRALDHLAAHWASTAHTSAHNTELARRAPGSRWARASAGGLPCRGAAAAAAATLLRPVARATTEVSAAPAPQTADCPGQAHGARLLA